MVKLTHGVGTRETGGCWMVACNVYSTAARVGWERAIEEAWADDPADVCPVVQTLGVCINDLLSSDEARERVIGPHLCLPSGTADEYSQERRHMVVDAVVRRWLPLALRASGFELQAEHLERLPAVTKENAASVMQRIESVSGMLQLPEYGILFDPGPYLTIVFRRVVETVDALDKGEMTGFLVRCATHAMTAAAEATGRKQDEFIETEVMPVMLAICAVGQRRELDEDRVRQTERVLAAAWKKGGAV